MSSTILVFCFLVFCLFVFTIIAHFILIFDPLFMKGGSERSICLQQLSCLCCWKPTNLLPGTPSNPSKHYYQINFCKIQLSFITSMTVNTILLSSSCAHCQCLETYILHLIIFFLRSFTVSIITCSSNLDYDLPHWLIILCVHFCICAFYLFA